MKERTKLALLVALFLTLYFAPFGDPAVEGVEQGRQRGVGLP